MNLPVLHDKVSMLKISTVLIKDPLLDPPADTISGPPFAVFFMSAQLCPNLAVGMGATSVHFLLKLEDDAGMGFINFA
jgi:hypothetical protein